MRGILRLFSPFLAGMLAFPLYAASERYDYDALGRVIRRVDDQSRVTEYVYDPAGNVLKVIGQGTLEPFAITSGPIGDQRRNESRQISLTGTGLTGVSIKASHSGISISQITQSATALNFRLAVSSLVPLGAQALTIEGAAGTAQIPFNVLPAIAFAVSPQPINLAPDGVARKYLLTTPEVSLTSRVFSLTTVPTTVAKPGTAQVTLPAGQKQVDFSVIAIANGTALLRLTEPGLTEPIEALVSVSSERLVGSNEIRVSRGMPFYNSPNSITSSTVVGVSRDIPWNFGGGITSTTGVGVVRSAPWFFSSGITGSVGVGVVRDLPWRVAPTVDPLVAPLVGINRP